MTNRPHIISTEDLTSDEIERLMRLARKERSLMAHKIMKGIYANISTALKNVAISTAKRCIKLFKAPEAPAAGSKGVSHV